MEIQIRSSNPVVQEKPALIRSCARVFCPGLSGPKKDLLALSTHFQQRDVIERLHEESSDGAEADEQTGDVEGRGSALELLGATANGASASGHGGASSA
jgi:hypothetical protein